MGIGNVFGWIDRTLGGKVSDVGPDLLKYGKLGQSTFDAGNAIADSEINTLRGYRDDYAGRLKNPLGTGPNSATGIFTRARGALSDAATQRTGAFGARLNQLAAQSGGVLSPEARAQLEEQNARDVNQELFKGNVGISDAQATLTLSETSKLFDRMENISKTILDTGTGRATQGLQAMLAALGLRLNRNVAIANTIVAGATKGMAGGNSQPTQPSGITGQD